MSGKSSSAVLNPTPVSTAVMPASMLQRKCACGKSTGVAGQCSQCSKEKLIGQAPPLIQPKLKISQPNDKYEQEADRMADMVMRMPDPTIQRQVNPEEKEEDETIQPKRMGNTITPMIQRQAEDQEEEEEETVQPKLLQNSISPLVQRQADNEEEEEEQVQLKSLNSTSNIQRQEVVEEEDEEDAIQTKRSSDHTPMLKPEVQSQIDGIRQRDGKPLSKETRAFMEPRFGRDFSNVRVHNNTRAADAARTVNARAFTLGNNVVFGDGQYSPDALAGRKLLAHELTHVVQQRRAHSETPFVQREIVFEDNVEQSRHSEVDPKTGDEIVSATLFQQFKDGALKHLAINIIDDGTKFVGAHVDIGKNVEIHQKFNANFPVEVIETVADGSEGFKDVQKQVSIDMAIKAFEEVQTQVVDSIRVKGRKVTIRSPRTALEKNDISSSQTPAAAGSRSSNEILVDKTNFKKLSVRSDVKESFDGFWILLHEMRHLVGKKDAQTGSGKYTNLVKAERPFTSRGKTVNPKLSLIGEVVSELNIIRIGLGLALRTNYADDGIINFTKEGPIGKAPLREEFAGAQLTGETPESRKRREETVPALVPAEETLQEKEKKRILGEWGKRLKKVKKGAIEDGGKNFKMDITIDVKDNRVEGTYEYTGLNGRKLLGKFKGLINVAKTKDSSKFRGVKVKIAWEEPIGKGKGFWQTTSENVASQNKTIPEDTIVPGMWGVKSESSGGEWFIEVPGDIRPMESSFPKKGR